MPHPNNWAIKREIGDKTISVTASYMKNQAVWGMSCRVNGRMVDHRQSDNPMQDAHAMIEAAILNDDEETPQALAVA